MQRSVKSVFGGACLWLVIASVGNPTATAQGITIDARCQPGTAEAYLDAGNVRAKITNNGVLFWNGGPPVYEVPKGGGIQSLFAASFIVTGVVLDSVRAAATTYGPAEFAPGPFTAKSPDACAEHDRIEELRWEDVMRERLPVELLGDQMLSWTMNDIRTPHHSTGSPPLGIEVDANAFAFNQPGVVGNTTFYRYVIKNVSNAVISDLHVGMFVDWEIGAAFDDVVGTDSVLNMAYAYNADRDDDGRYGSRPPAIGLIEVAVPREREDARCSGELKHLYYNNGGGALGDAETAQEFHFNLQARWLDGEPLTYLGDGRHFTRVPVCAVFTGQPEEVFEKFSWTEFWSGDGWVIPADRRSTFGRGPYDLPPGGRLEFQYAIVWSQGDDYLDSVRQLRKDAAFIKSIKEELMTPRRIASPKVQEPEVPFAVGVYPNPAGADGVTVRLSIPEALDVGVVVYDLLGRRVHATAGTGRLGGGEHQWTLPTGSWAPGVYLVRIQAGPAITTKRLVVSN